MANKKQKVNTSWMSNFAQQGSNQRFLDEIENYDRDLQREIQESADRTARNIYDIEQTRADIKFLEEDPEGYFYEKEQRELEKNPKTFENYRKNWWASHGRKMNDFQAQDFQGYMDRADQWERLANDVKSYWDIEDEIKNIDSQLAQWRLNTQNIGKMPIEKAKEAYGAIEILETQKQALQQRMRDLQPSVEAFKSYVPGALKAGYYDLVAGNGKNSIFSNNNIFGRTSQSHDELGDITRFTSSIFSEKRSRSEQRAMLDKALNAKQEKYKEWKQAFDENIKDREQYDKVDRWFKRREEKAGTDIFDSNTWLYGMPGLIAGSTSGLSKIIPATITGALTAAASYATGGLGALAIGALGGAGTFGLNYGAGVSENNAEVAMAYSDKIKDYLKNEKGKNGSLYDDVIKEGRRKLNMDSITIDDDQVFEQWRNGKFDISNAKVNKELSKLAIGMESQFQDDMAATTWSAGLETLLQVIPIGKVISPSKLLKFKAAKGGAADILEKGFELGSAASPVAGALYAPIHYMLTPVRKRAGRMASSIIDAISRTAGMSELLPKEVLKKKFSSSLRNKYIKDIAGRWILSSISEGIEEGKQHISAERFKNGYYTDAKIKSIGQTILDDFLAGSKSAGLLLGMPFESMMSEKDREILKEIKGGFILGGLQTGAINVSTSIYPYRQEQKATKAILNSVLLDKAAKIDKLNKAKVYANAAGSSDAYQNMIRAFGRLKDVNQREFDSSGEYGIAPDEIDNEIKQFNYVAAMSVDPYTIKQAKAQGIDHTSNEYLDFVAAKVLASDELEDAKSVYNEATKNRQDAVQQSMDEVLTERLKSLSDGEENTEEGSPVAKYSSAEKFNQLQNVAQYAALLRRKQQLEVGIENAGRGGHTRIKNILNEQLQAVDDSIKNMRSVISSYTHGDDTIDIDSIESIEKSLVLNKETHNKLSEAARAELVAAQDYDLAIRQYQKVVGKAYKNNEEIDTSKKVEWDKILNEVEFKDGDVKSIIKEIQDTIQDDDDLASVIDEDFEDRTDSEGNEIITPKEAEETVKVAPENNPVEEARAERQKERDEKGIVEPKKISIGEQAKSVAVDNVYYGSAKNQRQGVYKTKVNKEGNVITFEIDGKKQSLTLNGNEWTTLDDLKDLGLDENSDFVASRLFNGKDGNWYAEGFFTVNQDGLPIRLDQIVQLSENFDLQKTVERYTEERNKRYLDKQAKQKPIKTPSEPQSQAEPTISPSTSQTPPVSPENASQSNEFKSEQTKEQKDTIEKLNKLAKESKEKVKSVTPTHYVIEVNGVDIQMQRVHSVMPDYWQNQNQNKAALQVGNVFDNLARLFFGDKNNVLLYQTNKQSLVDRLFAEIASHKDNPNDPSLDRINKLKYSDLVAVRGEFEKTIDDMYALAKEYEKLGWELSTEPIVWHIKFPRGWVAGETDMVAVDRDGKIHIIDFKTAKAKSENDVDRFSHVLGSSEIIIADEDLNNKLLSLNKSDFTVGPRKKGLSKKARSVIKEIRRSRKASNLVLLWDDKEDRAKVYGVGSMYTATSASPMRLSHSYQQTDPNTGKQKAIVKGSKMYEYSDQLTAYQQMIKRSIADVVSMEVIGFRVVYTTDDNNNLVSISSIRNEVNGKPFRNLVSESAEMMDRLNMSPESVQPQKEVGPTPVETIDQNNANNQIKDQELKKADKESLKTKQQDDPQSTISREEAEALPITGYANINVNNLNQHPELVSGMVFDKDFISDAITNGTVEVYIEDVEYRGKSTPTVYADITYKGKTYKHLFVYDNPQLTEKVKQLSQYKKDGEKIVATNITRTAGKRKEKEDTPILKTTLVDQDINDVSMDSASRTFGFVKNGKVYAFAGSDITIQDPILEETTLPNGSFVYLKKILRSQSEGGDKYVPVVIAENNLAKDADFILDCLKNIDVLDSPYTMNINGVDVSIGATRRELLGLLIPFEDDFNKAGKTFCIVRDTNNPTRFGIIDKNKKMVSWFDFRDQKTIDKFKQNLAKIQVVDTHETLASRIGSPKAVGVFNKIKRFFANNKHGIKTLDISPSIKFDMGDFKGDGISGIGWYIKRGMFNTRYDGFEAPKVSINNVGLFNSPIIPKQSESTTDPIEPTKIDPASGFDLDDLGAVNWGSAPKRKTESDKNKPILTPEQIKKHLRPILGDLVDDPGVVQIIQELDSDPRVKDACVVGKASHDAITLYNGAFEYVDYHEAFHRIFELFVPATTRNAIYQKVAKAQNIDLSSSTKENNFAGHRQIAEWLADKYMEHRRYNISTNYNWLNRIINWISDVARLFWNIGDRKLYKVFLDINSGKYKNRRNASKENVERFNEIFGELNYEIHGQDFVHIANDPMYEELKNCAFFCLLRGQKVDLSGATVQNTQVTREAFQRGAESLKKVGFDIFGQDVDPTKKSAAQLAMTELAVKFDAIADDLATMMAAVSTDYRKVMQYEGREDADGGESQSSYDENFFKWSYEFDKFDKTTSRVKFFFATIPDCRYSDDSKKKVTYATNSLGLPQFIPMNYVFNEVLSNLWDVDTIEEVKQRLATLGMEDPMYAYILNNLNSIINARVNKDGSVNADAEALLAQLMNTIRSNRHTFMILRSVSKPEGRYDIVVQRSDADYNSRVFPMQWSQVLTKGGSETLKIDEYGNVVFNPKAKDSVKTFKTIAEFFNNLIDAVSSVNNGVKEITIPQYPMADYEYEDSMGNRTVESVYLPSETIPNITDPKNFRKVLAGMADAFNHIGINMKVEELRYMLIHKYGSADWESLKQMLQSTDRTDSIGSFMFFLTNISNGKGLNIQEDGTFVTQDGKSVRFDNVYSEMAFVKELGNWKYEFRHAHDQLSVLATGGNRFYEMSDNDYMSDVLRNCNKRGKWFADLKQDPYNYYITEDNFGEEVAYGSVTLKQLTDDPNMKVQLKHFIGFKTDKKNDEGRDYFEISRREDYLSKASILENGGIISLTLSDKKKYCYISGVKLPGIDYKDILSSENPTIDLKAVAQDVFVPDGVASAVYTIQQREDVIDQFMSYAISEYQSILRNAERLNDGHRKVVNFDDKEQSVKFSSLLGVWETTYDKEGNPTGEQFISFNEDNRSWEENLAIAEAYFFDRTEEEQKALIARNLSKIAEKELDSAVEIGLIDRVGNHTNPMYNYVNRGLNDRVIQSLTNSYMEKMKDDRTFTADMAHSMAIVVYINDISNKAIMSGQEMERIFAGNPAFYKWKYSDNGNLIDRTVDELKRLGGLGSTGINNFTQLKGIPEKYLDENGNFKGTYVAAEVDNEMVSSPQYEQISDSMYEGQLRSDIIDNITAKLISEAKQEHENSLSALRKLRKEMDDDEYQDSVNEEELRYSERLLEIEKEAVDQVDSKSVKELEDAYPEVAKESKNRADQVSIALSKDIDVADGGAYISDVMCEMLLRMEGAYSKEIEDAFKILRGEIKADYLNQIDAYQKVLTSVIGNQKYTAFGRRLQNGVSVPYYHKMALFPIFDCIATGKMRNVLDKMREQGIDMLLVNSAVKLGSEGSKSLNWSEFREDEDPSNENNFKGDIAGQDWKPVFSEAFNFNTYECEFDYLRKQLNTDPKEEELLRMGTQMQKVVYSNLLPGRTYTTQNGESITGRNLLDRIMNSSNKLSDIGVDKMNKRFFKTDDKGQLIDRFGNVIEDRNSDKREIDIVKFSKEVSKLMSERGADKNIMKALELVTSANDEHQLSIPLGAISNANWLESVLISAINKEVVDVNTPGAFFIQRSVWAMQGQKMFDRKKNIKGDEEARTLYNGERLQMVNEEGSMDCVLSLDFFKNILPQVWSGEYEIDEDDNWIYERGPNGSYKIDEHGQPVPKKKMRDMTFTEARNWLIKKGIIGENAKANIVAYRIPTQAESSIHALRCVDVLPVVRDTVILPEEFTKITGSDFDIDKLGLSTVNWKNGSDQFKEGTEEYYQNQLIRDYITLLIDPRAQHVLHRSIDNDTKLLKDVLKEIETDQSEQEMPYGFYSLSTQTQRKNDYITGKIGIGPFALNNNSHILTMLYGVKFKDIPDTIMTTLGLNDLSGHKDVDGNSIMSWLSALINAHVDIAKDPYISRLNVNNFTYNLVNTLIRTGFGKNTFYFTTQPIMKELASAYNNAASAYMADQYKSQWQLQNEAVQNVANSRFENITINGWKFQDIVKGITDPKNQKYRSTINHYIKSLIDNGDIKANANKDYEKTTGATVQKVGSTEFEHLSPEQVQALVYLAYLQFDPYALSVSNLVKYSKIDTKKHGKSYIEQQAFFKGFKKLFYNEDGGGLFEQQGLNRLAKQSYVELKTINAISMTKNILKGQFLQSTNAFDVAIQQVLGMIGKKNSLSVDLWNTISRAIMASIKSEFINQYACDLPQYHNTYIHDLVSESNETLTYTQKKGSNRIKITGSNKYPLRSYINKQATASFEYNGKTYTPSYTVIGYDANTNEIIVNRPVTVDNEGTINLTGGENTIYDRFNRLAVELRDNPDYHDLLDFSGEPVNMLLKSLVPGNTFEYVEPTGQYTRYHEVEDTYKTLKFIKLFNALDQNGPESNFIIDAWDELLHDEDHPEIKKFAEDLVVYAFVTSGDQGGFTKFFKQVPYSWRKESGYADFITRKLIEFENEQAIGIDQLEDAILNNWFDNQLVPKYNEDDFITYSGENKASQYTPNLPFPSVMAALSLDNGIYRPSIDPDEAPLFIKIPRRRDYQAKDSQRRVTIYRRMTFGMRKQTVPDVTPNADGTIRMVEKWVHFPIYVKVEPKGNKIRGNYLMTEYGREDSISKEYTPSEQGMRDMFVIGDIISDSEVQQYIDRFGNKFGQMVQDMNYQNLFETKFSRSEKEFTEAEELRKTNNSPELVSEGSTPGEPPFIAKLKQLGVITRVPKNFVSNIIRELDKQRADYNNVVKRSPVYIALQNMMDDFKRVADVNIPNNSSEDLKQQHEWLKQNLHKFDTINTNIDDNDESIKFYHDYLQKQYDFIKNYIKEFYNIDPELENMPYSSDEYVEDPLDNATTRIYNLLKFQYSQSPSESKLTDLVFNALKDSGIEFVSEDLGPRTSGRFVASENKILYNSNPEYIQPNTLLHEAIHAATSYYLKTANRDKLPQNIRIAIEEIEECYNLLKEDFVRQHFYENGQPKVGVNIEAAFSFWTQDNDTYGYTSPTEMVAELGKPSFVEHIKDFDRRHKGENVFQRLISAIAQLFGITKEYKSLEKTIKDALVVLLTNPNKELMDRYAKENNNIKVNHKALNDCNHINFENRRVIGEIVKELPEDTDDEYFDTVMKLPKNVAADSLQIPHRAHHPLTQSNKGAVFVFERSFFFTLNGDVTIDDEFVNVPIRIYSEQGLQNNVFEISAGENGIDYLSKVTPLFEDQKNLKQDVHGNYYGWSVQSIYNHLYSYVIESTGYSGKEKLSHVKKINALYGTNFRAFNRNGVWQLLNNTNSKDKLKLSENPNVPKRLELFEGIDQDQIRELKKEAEEIKKQCKGE